MIDQKPGSIHNLASLLNGKPSGLLSGAKAKQAKIVVDEMLDVIHNLASLLLTNKTIRWQQRKTEV